MIASPAQDADTAIAVSDGSIPIPHQTSRGQASCSALEAYLRC
jgi:hypothetical protein